MYSKKHVPSYDSRHKRIVIFSLKNPPMKINLIPCWHMACKKMPAGHGIANEKPPYELVDMHPYRPREISPYTFRLQPKICTLARHKLEGNGHE